MKYAITGASGQLGRIAINHLKTLTDPANIVALARTPEKVSDLGVDVRAFDYTEPDGLVAALGDVDVLALISSSDFKDRVGQHSNVIKAAKTAGVGRVVYTSILKADTSPIFLAQDHKATETVLAESGLTTTVLRNGWYTENWTAALPMAVNAGALIGSVGAGRVSPATRQDYGEALAAVVAGTDHDNKVYELGGAVFTMAELAAVTSELAGKDIPYNDMPNEAYADVLGTFGLPDGVPQMIADADAGAAQGWLLDESGALEALIGRKVTSLRDAAAAALSNSH